MENLTNHISDENLKRVTVTKTSLYKKNNNKQTNNSPPPIKKTTNHQTGKKKPPARLKKSLWSMLSQEEAGTMNMKRDCDYGHDYDC